MSLGNYTGQGILDWVLAIAGNALIGVLAIFAVLYIARSEWGKVIGLIAGAIIAGLFVWFPDSGVSLIQAFIRSFTGN